MLNTPATDSATSKPNWNQEEQIKKNQKAIEYFQKQIEEIKNMTEEEIKQGEEFDQLLFDLINKNRI